MIQRDYYWEYLQIVDNLLYEFTAEVKIKHPFAFHVNGVSIEKGIINWLWDQVMYQKSRRQWYNTQRLNGQSQAKVYNRLKKWFQHIFLANQPIIKTILLFIPKVKKYKY